MEYKRPHFLNSNKFHTFIVSKDEIIKDPVTNIMLPYQVSYIKMVSSSVPIKNVSIPVSRELIDETSREKHRLFYNLKASCVSVSQQLNDQLLRFILLTDEFYNNKIRNDEIMAMEFMALRNELSEIVRKGKIYHDIEALNTGEKRKIFTSIFHAFITDRNIYTHGQLHINIDDKNAVISFRKKSSAAYCNVNEEIFQSFFNAYTFLKKLMESLMKKLYDEKNKNSPSQMA